MSKTDLDSFLEHPSFSEIDRHFGRHVAGQADPASQLTGHAAALVSLFLQRGHICLHLGEPPQFEELESPLLSPWPDLATWRADLIAGGVVATDDITFLPMVLDAAGRLYLHRYCEYERRLAEAITRRVKSASTSSLEPSVSAPIDRLFPSEPDAPPDAPRQAALTAVRSRLMVLAGAPGTGKTTIVLKILAVLLEASPELEVALAAPTGKAANRMEESILSGLSSLDVSERVRELIPRKASTIHRLLGARGDSAFFRHNAAVPLDADVVVIDESSMVDLPIMAKLFDALKPDARVILVGDPDQLASVEAGSVLADIVRAPREAERGAEATSEKDGSEKSLLSRSIVTLHRIHRYAEDSGIRLLCEAIRAGNGDEALDLMQDEANADVCFLPLPDPSELIPRLRESDVVGEYKKAMREEKPYRVLEAMAGGRILCAVRGGAAGMHAVNEAVESILREEGLIGLRRYFYDRRPVIVVRNNYALHLFNGDTGVVLEREGDRRLVAHFQAEGETTRAILAVRLPEHESAFAMTVHRSQGSEFDHLLVILPPTQSPILTRELLYTSVSRARKSVTIWSDPDVFRWACGREVRRASGLSDRLRVNRQGG